jgi:hypothetical protein
MVHIYYHIYTTDGVETIIDEQLNLIKNHFDFPYKLSVGISIAEDNKSISHILNKFNDTVKDVRARGHEFVTLDLIEKDKKKFGDSDYILYLHTKGASKQNSETYNNIISWRHLMNYYNIELNKKAIAKQSYKTFYTLLTTELNTIVKNSSSDVMFNSYINNNNSAQISLFSQDKNSLSNSYFSNLNDFSLVGAHNIAHPFKVYLAKLLRQTYKAANTEATIRIESVYQLVSNKLQTDQTNNIVFTSLDQLLTIRKNLNIQINSLSNLLYKTMSVKTQKIKSLILKALGFRVLLASKTHQSKKTVITGFKLSKIYKIIYMVWSLLATANKNSNCISLLQNTLNSKPFVGTVFLASLKIPEVSCVA